MRIAIVEETRVLTIVVKGAERYVWIYKPSQRAAVLSQRVREHDSITGETP